MSAGRRRLAPSGGWTARVGGGCNACFLLFSFFTQASRREPLDASLSFLLFWFPVVGSGRSWSACKLQAAKRRGEVFRVAMRTPWRRRPTTSRSPPRRFLAVSLAAPSSSTGLKKDRKFKVSPSKRWRLVDDVAALSRSPSCLRQTTCLSHSVLQAWKAGGRRR